MMASCQNFSMDKICRRFKVIEFPRTLVGLSAVNFIDVGINLTTTAYVKTSCNGKLMIFEEARNISASHRAFELTQVDDCTIKIEFKPTNECISKAKKNKNFQDRFVIDIHVINASQIRCCNEEQHAEIGRYYICGLYEHCQIYHYPDVLNFGQIPVNYKVSKIVKLRNDSKYVPCRLKYLKVATITVIPDDFILPPNTSQDICIYLKPSGSTAAKYITLQTFNNFSMKIDECLEIKVSYMIPLKYTTKFFPRTMHLEIESLHKLQERNLLYTYTDDEFMSKLKHRQLTLQYLKSNKDYSKVITKSHDKYDNRMICWPSESKERVLSSDFCKTPPRFIDIFELLHIMLNPLFLNFGKVAINSKGVVKLIIMNNSDYLVLLKLLISENISYTAKQKGTVAFKIKPYSKQLVDVNFSGQVIGIHKGTFNYSIDNKYYLQHPFSVEVRIPNLTLKEKSLKFGMVSSDNYISSVPVYIYNHFNTNVNFKWNITNLDTPFEVVPSSGSVPGRTCRICDVRYLCTPSRTKSHEIELLTVDADKIPVELNICTRKHAIRFIENAVQFNDIPLNLEVIEKVHLENSSKEYAVFNFFDILIPGFDIEPMQGVIKPRMIVTVYIKVKIPYILEMSFDINVKINNKETIVLPVTGNVVEPKITINPKNIIMPRIPSHLKCFVPITFENTGTTKALIKVLDVNNDNIFKVYIISGNEKKQLYHYILEAGEYMTAYIKVYDVFRREYDFFLPFQINDLIGPPTNMYTTDLHFYIKAYEQTYESIAKLRGEKYNKTICYCRIEGVITLSWIKLSQETFEFKYDPPNNKIEFSIYNKSKHDLRLIIYTSRLSPNFSLKYVSGISFERHSSIKFDLRRGEYAMFVAEFHPKEVGRYVAFAEMNIDKYFTMAFTNLTFIGNHEMPVILPSMYLVVFPPCSIGSTISRCIELSVLNTHEIDTFSYKTRCEHVSVNFIKPTQSTNKINMEIAQIDLECSEYAIGKTSITFYYGENSKCEIEVEYCFTSCPLTLHANIYVGINNHPYPYYPIEEHKEIYDYMNTCTNFLERWLYLQGFRKEFYPIIPDSFNIISTTLSSKASHKSKGISVSYLNFIRRIANPLVKQIKKSTFPDSDGNLKYVKEICDIYNKIINIISYRGADIWFLQPQYLLSYEQFEVYCAKIPERNNADLKFRNYLINNVEVFYRLNKQSWIDFIIQTYKVFIFDYCHLNISSTTQEGNIIQMIIEWYNTQINANFYDSIGKGKICSHKTIRNITTDLSDGTAIIAAILNYCPFFKKHFSNIIEIDENSNEADAHKIHNTCLIIGALTEIKLNFPLDSKDLLQPNFLQMLFLSIHLYILLPSFHPKETLVFNPSLTESAVIRVNLNTNNQENLIYSYIILHNDNNAFQFEKVTSTDNIKKTYLNIKYNAYLLKQVTATLIVQGYHKTKMFDTYLVFYLMGSVGALIPEKKCKIVCPLYRSYKTNLFINSPFEDVANYKVCVLDNEPTLLDNYKSSDNGNFLVRRLNLIEDTVQLKGRAKDSTDQEDQKITLNIICLSKSVDNNWLWFKSDIGEFFIKVTTHPRVDLALEVLHANLNFWPVNKCYCAQECECYKTTIVKIPHKSEVALKCLKQALSENASEPMMIIFEQLIESNSGKVIIGMLLEEGGSHMSNITHILKNEVNYNITSKGLKARVNTVTLYPYTDLEFSLPITLTSLDPSEKYSLTMTSECGMDVRTYRIYFEEAVSSSS